MRVFILGLLAVVSGVNSHAIRYPYHNQLLAYTPARGEFPVYNELAQGFVRYFDNSGAEHQLGYTYPEPLYGVRRLSYAAIGSDGNQFLRTSGFPEQGFTASSYYQLQDTNDLAKAREEHFRRWCEQRYQALKSEMEKLRAEGVKPSNDMMAQLQPLEKIITATTYTSLSESPEIKRIRDEHLRIWNEARLKVLQQEASHLRFGHQQHAANAMKHESFGGAISDSNAIIGETAEQKKAREEHLRIYNEQLQKVKQLEAERLRDISTKNEAGIFKAEGQTFVQPISVELKSSFQQHGQQQQLHQQQQQQFHQTGPVQDTPEVMRAREEHLRLVSEAKIRAEAAGTLNTNDDGSYKPEKIEASPVLRFVPTVQQPIQPIQNIAILQTTQPTQQGFLQQQQSSYVKMAANDFAQQPAEPTPVQDTPEVIRAREEHLKLFNEAKLKAAQQTEFSNGSFQKSEKIDTFAAKAMDEDVKLREMERMREEQRIMEAERMREADRLLEEEKMREMERFSEMERQKEEERILEAQRLRLKQEEEQRMDKERMQEEAYLKKGTFSSTFGSESTFQGTQQQSGNLKTTFKSGSIDSDSPNAFGSSSISGTAFQGTQQQGENLKTTFKSGSIGAGSPNAFGSSSTSGSAFQGTQQHGGNLKTTFESGSIGSGSPNAFGSSSISGTAFQGTQQQGGNLKSKFESGSIGSGSPNAFVSSSNSGSTFQGTQQYGGNLKTTFESGSIGSDSSSAFGSSSTSGSAFQGTQQQGGNLKTTFESGSIGSGSSTAFGSSSISGSAFQGLEKYGENLKTTAEQGLESGSSGANVLSSATTSGSTIHGTQQQDSHLKTTAGQGFESGSSGFTSGSSTGGTAGSGFIFTSQYKDNPYLVRIASDTGSTANIIGGQQTLNAASPNRLYLPSHADYAGSLNKENPFLMRFSGAGLQGEDAQQQQITGTQSTEFKPVAGSEKISTYSSASSSSQTGSANLSGIKLNYGSNFKSGELSELEKATRDHFRAHELALEQLRLANAKTPFKKDC